MDNPVSLALVGDDLFWSSTKSLKLNWTPKHSFVGTKAMHIEHPYTSSPPTTMQLLTITGTTTSKHPCAQHGFNGGCSHICIAMNATSHMCLCTLGMVFADASNTTCIEASVVMVRSAQETSSSLSLGTVSIIVLLIVVVGLGGLFAYRRFYDKPNTNISMHFENPRSALEAARVKMCKFNEIMIHRNNNNNNNIPPCPMTEEQEIAYFANASTSHDDTQKLLI